MEGRVEQVSSSAGYTMAKQPQERVRLIEGMGVEGDVHAGTTVKHRSRIRRDPTTPNLRQVHLLHAELLDELRDRGFDLVAGEMGENLTTRGLALLDLPTATRLMIGHAAVVELTGLRDPCVQLDGIQPRLMRAVLDRDEHGAIVRKAGVMSIVLVSGEVHPGDPIRVELPNGEHRPLGPV